MVSRQDARATAEEYSAGHSVSDATGRVRSVKLWDEIDARKPDVYGYGDDFWSDHWVVYLERRRSAFQSSLVLAVHRATGEVDYAGLANVEG